MLGSRSAPPRRRTEGELSGNLADRERLTDVTFIAECARLSGAGEDVRLIGRVKCPPWLLLGRRWGCG